MNWLANLLPACCSVAWVCWLALGPLAANESAATPVLLIAGQSREEFRDYLQDVCQNGSACPLPGGAAFYTSLDLSGFTSPHTNVPRDNHQDMEYLRLRLDPLVMQVALWLSREQLYEIDAGELDGRIAKLRELLDTLKRPVFLRIGYEFDGPHNRYPPQPYVAAYRRIARAMRGNPDILLTWHSFAMLPTYQQAPFAEWYPGDEWVDWVGISFFQVGEEGYHKASNREAVLAFARARGKPVLVAEASPIRYTRRQKTLVGDSYWDYWFVPFFEMIEHHPEIKAVSIINVNWDSQIQHRELDWGDSRLNADPVVLARWRAKMAESRWVPRDLRLYDTVRQLSQPASHPAPASH